MTRIGAFLVLAITIGLAGCGRSTLQNMDAAGQGQAAADARRDGTLDVRRDGGSGDERLDGPADGRQDGRPDAGLDSLTDGPPGDGRSDGSTDGRTDSRPTDARDGLARTLTSIEISPPAPALVVGIPFDVRITAIYSDATRTDVTSQASLSSSEPGTVRVSGATLTGLRAGSATVSAGFGGRTATAPVTVSEATLSAITIEPAGPLAVQQTVALTAMALFSNGNKQDVTGQATWTSSDPSVASVSDAGSGKGQVTGLRAGTTTVRATLQGVTGSTSVVVTAATVQAIAVYPAQASLQRGVSQQYRAVARYSDDTTAEVTAQATWSTSDAGVATVVATGSDRGMVTALATGTAIITATLGPVIGSTPVTVTAPALTEIAVSPATWSTGVGGTRFFTAQGTFADRSTADLTASVVWSSSAGEVVAISNGSGAQGQAIALAAGTAIIRATLGGVTGSATATVTSVTLSSLSVSPEFLILPAGRKGALAAWASYSDGSSQDVTLSASWSVGDGTVAAVSNSGAGAGQVTGLVPGETVVTATLDGRSAGAKVSVTSATLDAVEVAPSTANVTAGGKQAFTATARYSDGNALPVTDQVTWSSSNTAVAQISNSAGTQGVASSLIAGKVTIKASLNGVAGSATLVVGEPVLAAIMLTPAVASIEVGQNQSYQVRGIYSNGTQENINTGVTLTSSDPAVATVSSNRRLRAEGVSAGTVTIKAAYKGMSDSATLTVTAVPTLVGLAVTPASASIRVGESQGFQASAIFSDGTQGNVTNQASWTTSNANVAVIGGGGGSGGNGQAGRATGVGAGAVTITATYKGFTDTAALEVRAAAPVGLVIAPATAAVVVNGTQAFQAMVTFDDGTTQNVTGQASWTTSDPGVASITDGGGSRGVATGQGPGTAVVTATWGGFSATAGLTVTAAKPVSLVLTPAAPSVLVGQTPAFQATLVYDNNTTSNVTGQADWTSSEPTVAVVGNGGRTGPGGVATALAPGTTVIAASFGGLTGKAVLTVSDPPLLALQITPTNPSITLLLPQQQFVATAIFEDYTTRTVTGSATWTSSNPAVAIVSNGGGTAGRATAVGEGTTSIAASYGGMSAATTLTVAAASVVAVQVTPTNPTAVLGVPVALVATAILSNGTTATVTGPAAWISSDLSVATVSNGGGGSPAGTATPLAAGTTTVSATYQGVSGSTTLTVSSAKLASIAITPAALGLPPGAHQQLTATGTYDDSSTRDLTAVVTWLSASDATATVSNAPGSRGDLTAVSPGTTSITAHFQGVTGTLAVTVGQ